eukprot:TRINITY_DN534_c0_g1_i1.p1 TRINITY_DN534_c0_g1~~TRINITY_DN534_c0_g1_i1.p1  ORF type:complete len:437 (-),score=103.90 TRINITY_DN534_c0_g1_i1:399-1664(-)
MSSMDSVVSYRLKDGLEMANIEIVFDGDVSLKDLVILLTANTISITQKGRKEPLVQGVLFAPILHSKDKWKNKSDCEITRSGDKTEFVQHLCKKKKELWPTASPVRWSLKGNQSAGQIDAETIDATSLFHLSRTLSDVKLALECIVSAANKGHEDSLLALSTMYQNKDPATAKLYEDVLGPTPNYTISCVLLERCYDLYKSVDAMVMLAVVEYGAGRVTASRHWLVVAETKIRHVPEHAMASLQLAMIFEEGTLGTVDLPKALEYYRKYSLLGEEVPQGVKSKMLSLAKEIATEEALSSSAAPTSSSPLAASSVTVSRTEASPSPPPNTSLAAPSPPRSLAFSSPTVPTRAHHTVAPVKSRYPTAPSPVKLAGPDHAAEDETALGYFLLGAAAVTLCGLGYYFSDHLPFLSAKKEWGSSSS